MDFDYFSINFLILIFLIFLGGFVDSIAGGGGIITLPAYMAFGIPAHLALGTNKFSGFFGTFSATIKYARHKVISFRLALISTVSSIIGSIFGSQSAVLMSEKTINFIVLIITPIVLIIFIIKDFILRDKNGGALVDKSFKAFIKSVVIGLFVGFYDGLFGPGTGTFMTIGFNAVLGLDLINASGTARLCNLGSNFGSLIIFISYNKILFPLAFYTAIAGITGNLLGASLAIRKGGKIIKPLISFVMLLLIFELLRKRFL